MFQGDNRWATGGDASVAYVRDISAGSTSGVFEMRNLRPGKVRVAAFARKVIHHLMSAVDIQREVYAIQSVCRIPHQNIVKVWRHGQLPNSGQYYIDMELCDLSLREFIRSGGGARLSLFSALLQGGRVAYAWKIMEKVAAGLEHIHGQGLVHRDIKPENILFASNDQEWKIADFGLTMEGYSQVGRTTCDSRGTTGYRAPEIIVEKNEFEKAKFSKKSDIWALGCLIYESVFLEHAFSSDISIKHFSISGKPLSVPYALDVNGLQRDSLSYILQSTLHFNPKKRISAEDARSFCSVQSNSDVIKIRHTCPEPRYLYAVRCLPLAPAYPGFEEDVTFLIDNTTIVTDEPSLTDLNRGIRVIVTTITSRSPSQIADLCEQFTNRCGRNLAAWLASNLDSHIPAVEIFPIVALASSPLDLDLYILEKFRMKRSGAWDDLLVDLCVGRNENDLKRLAFEYLQRYEKLPREAWLAKASNDLKPALEIILEFNRPSSHEPVDNKQVKKDVKAICAQVAKKLWRDQDKVLFNIFLRRSDTHIASVINSFDEIENKPLDEAIMGYDHLHRFAKNILLHAIRSVSNMARRDALYLRQDVDYNRSVVWDPVDTERLCARVCRMHKYPQHWHVIMKDFENLANGSFISSIRGAPKPYSKFMVNIYEMICSQ